MSYNVNLVPNIAAVGTVRQYAFPPLGATDPNGWVICDGNLRSNETGTYNNLISRGLYSLNSFTIK
jgi:hypothetical protein